MRSTSPKALPKFSQRAWPDYYPSAFRCRLEQCLCRGCLPPQPFRESAFFGCNFRWLRMRGSPEGLSKPKNL